MHFGETDLEDFATQNIQRTVLKSENPDLVVLGTSKNNIFPLTCIQTYLFMIFECHRMLLSDYYLFRRRSSQRLRLLCVTSYFTTLTFTHCILLNILLFSVLLHAAGGTGWFASKYQRAVQVYYEMKFRWAMALGTNSYAIISQSDAWVSEFLFFFPRQSRQRGWSW